MRWTPLGLWALMAAAACAAPVQDDGAARAAWARKLQDYQQCKAQQRAPSYGPAASAPAKKACVDPGPFVPASAASAAAKG